MRNIEVYVGLALAIVAIAVRLTWWLTSLIVLLVAGIFLHLISTLPTTHKVKASLKVGISLAAFAIIALTIWRPTESNDSSPKPSPATQIVNQIKKLPTLLSGSAHANAKLKSDTADLVKQLREFQQKIDQWNSTVASRMNDDRKNETGDAAGKLSIERAKELSALMANLNRQFNDELKPQVIAIRKELLSKLPAKSVPAKPTVDWTLQYGFSTFPDAIADIANYLEDLARMLPEK
jgi:hypothetical protein